MSDFDPNQHRTRPSSARRWKTAAGVTGAAVVLGGGALVMANRSGGETEVRDVAAPAPVASAAAVPASATTPAPEPTSPAAPGAAAPSPSPAATAAEPVDPKVKKEIVIARSKAAADGVPLRRGIDAKSLTAADDVKVETFGTPQSPKGTLKVVSARADLTGHGELSWASDEGEKVGSARCTQKFRLSNDMKPMERPSLLLCWRTSAERSVYTVAVTAKSRPSKEASVEAITKAWAKLS